MSIARGCSNDGCVVVHEAAPDDVADIVRGSRRLRRALVAARGVALPDWYLAAGPVRNAMWARAHGLDADASDAADVDVVFFDADDRSAQRDVRAQAALTVAEPTLPWEATNQAAIHHWYRDTYGVDVPPRTSAAHGISGFPETATCIGLRLLDDDALVIVAPWGLDDLRRLVWRRNVACPVAGAFDARLLTRNVQARWPRVTIVV